MGMIVKIESKKLISFFWIAIFMHRPFITPLTNCQLTVHVHVSFVSHDLIFIKVHLIPPLNAYFH